MGQFDQKKEYWKTISSMTSDISDQNKLKSLLDAIDTDIWKFDLGGESRDTIDKMDRIREKLRDRLKEVRLLGY